MRKVLLTGGCGFVGRHFCRRLLERGDEVHCVDSVVRFTGGIAPDAPWPLFDPRDYERFHFYRQDCRAFFREHRDTDFDVAFHLAAMVGGRLMIEDNPLAVADDLSIDAHYWQWAKETQPAKSVCFSSSAAYPVKFQRRGDHRLLKEEMIDFKDDIGMPDMSYGWAKLTMEYLGRLAYEKHGLKSVVYRPFSGYGEDQDASYPFPAICRRILANRGADALSVWGSGRQKRDFIHIEDCVEGVLVTMDRIDNGDAVNLSTGIYTDFIELTRMGAEIAGFRPRVTGLSDKPEGVFARGGDTTKQRTLGFRPRIALKEGLQRALEYFARLEA
jgi:GDP-L-fucose synthase